MSFVVRPLASEKRDIFFPEHPVVCRTCHKPRVKRLINLEDFSDRHQELICMSGRPHGRVPAAAGGVPPGVPPVPASHAGPHINPLYVTRNEFNAFRVLVTQNIQQLQNQQNQMDQNVQQLQNQQNQMNQNVQQLQNQQNQMNQNIQQLQNQQNQMNQQIQNHQNQIGQDIAGIFDTLGNINNNLRQINRLLGIQ